MNIKFDFVFNGEFIVVVGLKGFYCFVGGKFVDVDEGVLVVLEVGVEVSFGGEGVGDEIDVGVECEEVFCVFGVGVVGEDLDGVGFVLDEVCDYGDVLGVGVVDDEDGWFGGYDVWWEGFGERGFGLFGWEDDEVLYSGNFCFLILFFEFFFIC